jgi:hypothetical protein
MPVEENRELTPVRRQGPIRIVEVGYPCELATCTVFEIESDKDVIRSHEFAENAQL